MVKEGKSPKSLLRSHFKLRGYLLVEKEGTEVLFVAWWGKLHSMCRETCTSVDTQSNTFTLCTFLIVKCFASFLNKTIKQLLTHPHLVIDCLLPFHLSKRAIVISYTLRSVSLKLANFLTSSQSQLKLSWELLRIAKVPLSPHFYSRAPSFSLVVKECILQTSTRQTRHNGSEYAVGEHFLV